MPPSKYNINKPGCVPQSTNCVTWQSGDIPGIDLCKTDSVGEVIQKVNTVVQTLKDELDLSDLDISEIIAQCAQCPEPSKTLKNVIELLINKIVSVESLYTGGNTQPGTVTLTIASCFRTPDQNGDPILSMEHSAYTRQIGLQVCSILLSLGNITNQLTNLDERVTTLEEDQQTFTIPQASLKCVAPGASAENPVLKNVDLAIELLEGQFCDQKAILGETTELATSLGSETQKSGNPAGIFSLTNPNTTLWSDPATTMAAMFKHMWLVINDTRGAVKLIQDNCCKITCDDIIVDFDIKLSDDRQTMSLFFLAKTTLPNGFSDCNASLGNKLTITDSAGNIAYAYVKVADQMKTGVDQSTGIESPVVIDLSATAIDPNLDYTLSMDCCMTDGSTNCVKCITKSVTYKNTCAFCEIDVAGVDGDTSGSVTILYEDPTPSV